MDRLKKGLAILVALVIGITVIVFIIRFAKSGKDNTVFKPGNELVSEEDYAESLKSQESEIPGMTKYDKYTLGLNPDEADTDNDGLSDYDELKVYESDPLKRSTAGDMYSDAYKVANGMDVSKVYEYTDPIVYEWNNCSEVSFDAKNIDDLYAVAEDLTDTLENEDLNGLTVYKKYRIYNYSNIVKIDLTDVLKSNSITTDDIGVFIYKLGAKTEKAHFRSDGNVITLRDKFDYESLYYVYIVSKNGEIKNSDIITSLNSLARGSVSNINNYECGGMLTGTSLGSLIGRKVADNCGGFTIFYFDSGNDNINNQIIEKLTRTAAYYGATKVENMKEHIKIIEVSKESYYKRKDAYLKLFPSLRTDSPDDQNFLQACWNYTFYENVENLYWDEHGYLREYEESEVEYAKYFDIEKETLPFGNFASYIGTEGNCMGIAMLTAKVHNQGSTEATGQYRINDNLGTKSWDLTTSDDNKTLLNRGLNDYKNSTFVKERSNKKTGYIEAADDSEQQFIDMIGSYWAKGNEIMKAKCKYRITGSSNYNIEMFDPVLKRLDNNEVLICGMGTKAGAHAVNVYGYVKNDDGTIDVLVYDNNYPSIKSDKLIIKITPKTSVYGNTHTFEYEFVTDKYTITSVNAGSYFMLFMDDEFKIIAG